MDEHALLAREPGGRLVQHPREQPPVRGRRADVAAGERELERVALDLRAAPRSCTAPAGPAPRPARAARRPAAATARSASLEHLHDRRARLAASPRPRARARASRTPSASRSARRSTSGRELLRPESTVGREPDAGGRAARARASPRPCSAARASHCSRSRGRSTCSFASRVASAATRAAAKPVRAERLHVLEQRLPPRRERPHRLLRHPDQLGHPLDRLRPLEPEPPGELVPQLGLVEVAGREPVGAQDRLAVERPPLAVRACGPCWRRSRACADADPARARCDAGTPPPRTPRRARAPRRRGRGAPRRPRARGSRAPPARPTRAPR